MDIFKQSGINIKEYYKGKKLQIRGVFKPVNGVLVTASHPEQLTVLYKKRHHCQFLLSRDL